MTKNFAKQREMPFYGEAVLAALQFSGPDLERVRSLNNDDWTKLLAFCDAAQLTFTFAHMCGSDIPDWVRSRIDRNRSDSAKRRGRLDLALGEISRRFNERGIEFALLKGSAHARWFSPDPTLRSTADIDLLCRPEALMRARDELLSMGYRSVGSTKGRHLPPMVRETEWHWRGDYYASDLPLPVDLHYKLWDEKLERIAGPPEDEFWSRRSYGLFGTEMVAMLALPDALAFAAIHLLMHILHGDTRLQRAWEIGYFLNNRAADDAFWFEWKRLHPPELRMLEVLIFLLVESWFGCKLSTQVEDEAKPLSPDIKLWLDRYASSPVEALFTPNKNELWLNLCLIRSFRGRARVFLRRVLPIYASGDVCTERGKVESQPSGISTYNFRHSVSRAIYHARTLAPTLVEGMKWWRIRQAPSRQEARNSHVPNPKRQVELRTAWPKRLQSEFPLPPGLVDTMDDEELEAIRPALVVKSTRNK